MTAPKTFAIGGKELVDVIADYVSDRERIVGPCRRAVTFVVDTMGNEITSVTATVRFEPMTDDEVFDAFSQETP